MILAELYQKPDGTWDASDPWDVGRADVRQQMRAVDGFLHRANAGQRAVGVRYLLVYGIGGGWMEVGIMKGGGSHDLA